MAVAQAVWKIIYLIVGFNFTIVPTDGYGSVDKDGRWNGMIRELLEEVRQTLNDIGLVHSPVL